MAFAEGGILEEVINYLVTQSYGTKGVDLFMNFVPSNVKNVTVLFETSGIPTIYSSVIPDYRFQAMIRNKTFQAGRVKTKTLYNALHNKKDFLANSSVSLCKSLSFPASWVLHPETELYEFYMNFTMTIKESFS
jgi:hypothetical protein